MKILGSGTGILSEEVDIKPRKVIEKRPEVYSDKEIEQILGVSGPEGETLLLALLYTGLREQELCHLNWDDLDFERKVLRVTAPTR